MHSVCKAQRVMPASKNDDNPLRIGATLGQRFLPLFERRPLGFDFSHPDRPLRATIRGLPASYLVREICIPHSRKLPRSWPAVNCSDLLYLCFAELPDLLQSSIGSRSQTQFATSSTLWKICNIRISQICFLLQKLHPRLQELGTPKKHMSTLCYTSYLVFG